MLKCVIIDDEPLAQDVLQQHLEKIPYVQLSAKFTNTKDALAFLSVHEADALFLDIEMPGMSGIEFLTSLEDPPPTVFTTAYRNYAFEGFELGVIDFLLKPIAFPRLQAAIEKIRDFHSLKKNNASLETTNPQPEFIFVKSGVMRIKLFFNDVTHIQGLKDYAIIHTHKEKIVIKGSVKNMQSIFPSPRFIRIHKSFIVALNKVRLIENNRVTINDHHIPVGRSYKAELEQLLRR
ncbi:MAG: LytTR family DNA-binding domain-containing protein [Chitinophagaceae bacterium]